MEKILLITWKLFTTTIYNAMFPATITVHLQSHKNTKAGNWSFPFQTRFCVLVLKGMQ